MCVDFGRYPNCRRAVKASCNGIWLPEDPSVGEWIDYGGESEGHRPGQRYDVHSGQ